MTNTLGIAISGCGQFGTKRAQAVSTNSFTRLIGVYDPDKTKAKQFAKNFHTKCFSSFEELIDEQAVQAVIISSPNNLHAHQSRQALLQHKHVLCEKPAGINQHDFNALSSVLLGLKTKQHWQYGYNHRFFEPIQQLKEWLDRSEIGHVLELNLKIASGRNHSTQSWFTDLKQAGGGTLIDNGHHLFDLLLWLMPNAWEVMSAIIHKPTNQDTEDQALVVLEADEVRASIQSQWLNQTYYLTIEAIGENGKIIVTDQSAVLESSITNSTKEERYTIRPGYAVTTELNDWLSHCQSQNVMDTTQNLIQANKIYNLIASAYATAKKNDSS